jgi:hypothetical protein
MHGIAEKNKWRQSLAAPTILGEEESFTEGPSVPLQDFFRNSASVSLLPLFRASSTMASMPRSLRTFCKHYDTSVRHIARSGMYRDI